MENHDNEELYDNIPAYVKRPDLRIDELPGLVSLEEVAAWKWWILSTELHDEELQDVDPEVRLHALLLPTEQKNSCTPDPAKILALFCLCHEWRVYPPAWIMDEMYNRFDEYLKDNGGGKKKRRLGEYFGEPARGDRSAFFRQEAFKPVMESAFMAVDRLRFCFDLSKEEALGIVAGRFELIVNKTAHSFKKGEAALEKAYREWCKADFYQCFIEPFKNRSFTVEENKEFLRTFPPDSFTGYPHIENLLKD